jgi:hypothetical protein
MSNDQFNRAVRIELSKLLEGTAEVFSKSLTPLQLAFRGPLPIFAPAGKGTLIIGNLHVNDEVLELVILSRMLDSKFARDLKAVEESYVRATGAPRAGATSMVLPWLERIANAATRAALMSPRQSIDREIDKAILLALRTSRYCERCGLPFTPSTQTRRFCGRTTCPRRKIKVASSKDTLKMRKWRERRILKKFEAFWAESGYPPKPAPKLLFDRYLAHDVAVEDFLESRADRNPQFRARLQDLSRYRTRRETTRQILK